MQNGNQDPKQNAPQAPNGEGEGQNQNPKPQEPDVKPNPNGEGEGGEGGQLIDKHGQPAISQGKYKRDMDAANARIAELEAQIAEAAKVEKSRDELMSKIEELKSEMSGKAQDYELQLRGCVDPKAAQARLADFDGNYDALAEACPYLFAQQKPQGKTGLQPKGAPQEFDVRAAMGLK